MSWSRSSGPLRVWRNVELVKSDGKKLKFIIQDIPKERYTEVVEHMCTVFVKDETTLSSIKISEDPEALNVVRDFWNMTLEQGISIGAFEQNTNNEKPKLAGVNVLTVVDEETDNKLQSYVISHIKMKKFFDFIFSFSVEGDPRPIFNIDCYLSAFGLSVDPKYRGFGLGKQLLEIRNDIGRLYNIKVTETIFTSARSQEIAAAVGFKEHLVRAYEDIVDEEGEKLFPSLAGKQIKLMIKELL